MNHYTSSDKAGFWHQPSKRDRASLSSTATCVSSLARAGIWNHDEGAWGKTVDVAERLLKEPRESAGLRPNNAFSLSFIAEGVLDLVEADPYETAEQDKRTVTHEIIPLLASELDNSTGPFAIRGSVGIKPYPPSAYLTQLGFRLVKRCPPQGFETLTGAIRTWARGEIHRQVALISTRSRIADPLQLAYAVVLAASASADEQTSPEEKALVRGALKTFFDAQQPDGSWPLSQPLFHYPDVGNAHCFDYEVLTQLLRCEPLQDELLQYLPKLELAARQLRHTSFELGVSPTGAAVGGASGHHPQIEGPESWSTACVYDFVHVLDRLVAEAVRQALFRELRAVYSPPERTQQPRGEAEFAPKFLDADLRTSSDTLSLKNVLRDYFVLPIARERSKVANGGRLQAITPMSAILFGPPGTSKTQLTKLISKFLGWPLLSVDPSYLVQDGIDHLYARANRLFSMLAMAEQIVVILDEFDEMGRERTQNTDLLSRFITTAMLPKLAAINDERKIVFLLATNFVSKLDAAFSRGGRFDMLVQVMPPTAQAKLENPDWSKPLQAALKNLPNDKKRGEAKQKLSDLTYLETQQLVFALEQSPDDVSDAFRDAASRGTLARLNGSKTWKESCVEEQTHIRLPAGSFKKRAAAEGPIANVKPRRRATATKALSGPA